MELAQAALFASFEREETPGKHYYGQRTSNTNSFLGASIASSFTSSASGCVCVITSSSEDIREGANAPLLGSAFADVTLTSIVASPISRPVPDTQQSIVSPKCIVSTDHNTHKGQGGWQRADTQGTIEGTRSAPYITHTHHRHTEGYGFGLPWLITSNC